MDNGEVDRFLSESLLSFKHAQSKNSARRGSLVKKTKGLELQWKMANAKMSKEERQLRESLRQMKIEQRRTNAVKDVVAKSKESKKRDFKCMEVKKCPSAEVDPYPVTFPSTRSPSPGRGTRQGNHGSQRQQRRPGTGPPRRRPDSSAGKTSTVEEREINAQRMDETVRLQAARARGRRVSHEFEDLHIDTKTGSLNPMKSGHIVASRLLFRELSSGTELCSSSTSVSSVEDLYWAGEPEAITSVRRPRKTSEQQNRDTLVKKSIPDANKK